MCSKNQITWSAAFVVYALRLAHHKTVSRQVSNHMGARETDAVKLGKSFEVYPQFANIVPSKQENWLP